jgi:cytochrome c-type biogenesis protein CcmF
LARPDPVADPPRRRRPKQVTLSQQRIVIRILGDTTLALACALTLGGIVAGVRAGRRGELGLLKQAEWFAYIIFGLLTLATGAMLYALVTHDFSVSYVAQVGSRSTPLWVTIVSLWSALEGSLLFWGFVLALLTALVAWRTPRSLGPVKGYTIAVLMGIGTFFYFLLVVPASPFMPVSPVPLDGPGPNPLLQNHWLMVVHPPLQYLGYVGMSVPFAFAMGAMLARRNDGEWIRVSRNWMLWAWGFLTLAVVAGMWWSYEVLGWGGYWAWDPVENAAFMPWLTATAYLHSVMVQERRGMLKVWNINLIIATFALTILGTFLTRSGIISSVHAFSAGPIGYYFLGFIGVILVFSFALLAGRSTELSTEGRLDGVASRDTVFLINNMVLTAFTFTVLLGTLFPVAAEAVRGVKVSVGPPFFNQMTLPLMMALLFLMGVGPALPWRRATREEIKRKLGPPTVAASVVLIAALLFGVPSFYAVLAFAFGAFALVSNGQEYVVGARARMRAHGENVFTAIGRLTMANRHRYGGYVAHIGVIAMAVGITASSAYKQEHEFTMRPGDTVHVAGYDLRFDRLWAQEEPRRFTVGADVGVLVNGRQVASMSPRLNYYQMRDEPIPTPHVRSRMTDLYLNLMAFERDGSTATIAVFIEPLVVWIWIGGAIIGLGVGIAVWPQRPRRAPQPQPATPSPRPAAHPKRRRKQPAGVGGD